MNKPGQREKLKKYLSELSELSEAERVDAVREATLEQVQEIFSSDAPMELMRIFEDRYPHIYPPTFEQSFAATIAGVRFAFEDAMMYLKKMLGKEKMIEVCKYQAEQGNTDALKIMMLHYADEDDEEALIEVFKKAAALGNGIAAKELAVQYSREERNTQAEEYYLMAIKNGAWMAHEDYGLFLERLGRTDEAIEQYIALLRYDRSGITQLITLLELEGRHEEAEFFKKMGKLN